MMTCRWCHRPAVTTATIVERGSTVHTISVSYLCHLHDTNARRVRTVDRMRREAGLFGVDAIVAPVEVWV